jgi:chloride channel protein, CIC family
MEGLTAQDLLNADPVVVYTDETCRDAAERMATAGVGRLPVLSPDDPKRVVGIISRSDLLKPRLMHHEEERKYERYFGKGREQPQLASSES